MDFFDVLNGRRSIRKYTSEEVSDEDLHVILAAAMQAPSARNEQPWHFVVAKKPELRAELAKTSPYTHMAANAPLVILVCADMGLDKAEGMWVQDCAAATQNLLLAVTARKLGAVWCGVHPNKEREAHARKVLDLPAHITPFGLICIGHPAQNPGPEDRYQADRAHMDRW